MGNSNSVVCCVTPGQRLDISDEVPFKMGQTERTADTSILTSAKKREDGYSLSSISSKSSKSSNQDNQEHEHPIPEMRNDADWHNSLSEEIRVAESSYDEATTEALDEYYGETRYPRDYHQRPDATDHIRDE